MTVKTVYLNGEFIDAKQAMISVFDRGFMFADAIYEVMLAHNGKLFIPELHFKRLSNNLKAISIKIDTPEQQLKEILGKLISLNDPEKNRTLSVYIQISRGNDNYKRSHVPGDDITPTFFASCENFTPKTSDELNAGLKAITLADKRRNDCFIKATGLMPNTQALTQAKQAGCDEAILIRDGNAIEATSSNLFIIKNKTLITPTATDNILHGTTRKIIIDLAKQNNIPCQQQPISQQQLLDADEVFITGSLKGIWPIVNIDKNNIADGKVGAMTKQLLALFQDFFKNNLVSF